MKLSLKQLILFLGGSGIAVTAKATDIVHADTVIVQKGDTTWDIARTHKTTVKQIVKDNHLSHNGSLIFINQKLEVNKPDSNDNEIVNTTKRINPEVPISNHKSITPKNNIVLNNQNVYNNQTYVPNATGAELAAKEWIATRESGGSYTARNGKYIGRYQLDARYLHGDYSPANQERVADSYVKARYGSWQTAKYYWITRGWY